MGQGIIWRGDSILKLTANKLLKLLSPFYTSVGKQLCLALLQGGYIKESFLLKQSPAINSKEPPGDDKAEEAQKIAGDWAWGIVSDNRLKSITNLAREEAMPVLLSRDIDIMRGLI